MPEIPVHSLRPRRPPRRYIDGDGFIRCGRPRAGEELPASQRVRMRRLDWLAFVALLPRRHPVGFEDIRGACCGK